MGVDGVVDGWDFMCREICGEQVLCRVICAEAGGLGAVGIGFGQVDYIVEDGSRMQDFKVCVFGVGDGLAGSPDTVDMAEVMGLDAPLTHGSVVASDAFFPFADGVLTAAEAGAVALIQPGGSMRDDEVIAAADEAGLAMVFTGMRHFRH